MSTWQQDIQKYNTLVNHFNGKGVKFIAVPDLDEGGPANIYRQWRTMEAGLCYIPSDAIVLKGRTDKFLLRKDIISAFINNDFRVDGLDRLNKDILAVEHISTSLPFMAKDMIFLGTASAIRKILHYSVRTKYVADYIYNGIGPECFLWLELAKQNNEVMQLIQKLDFRFISNHVIEQHLLESIDTIDNNILFLYHKWIEVFEQNLCFISDILMCDEKVSWVIDEGIWKYIIGDRTSYNQLKSLMLTKQPEHPQLSQSENLNGVFLYQNNNSEEITVEHPFESIQEEIRQDYSPQMSDVVLIRSRLIDQELSKQVPHPKNLEDALHWNIRQRDRNTLQMAYQWMMNNDSNLKYITLDNQIFVLERMLDFFTFSNNQIAIDNTIKSLPKLFKATSLLKTRVAEYYFRHQKLWKALYWFYMAYVENKKDLGINHGLGCTLLDLKLPRIAIKYLKQAHNTAPFDQTAIFTLFRATVETKNFNEANKLKALLNGNLLIEANNILKGK